MDALGVYYGGAICDNIGDVDAMEKAIWAVFHHCASTDEDPQHQFCPVTVQLAVDMAAMVFNNGMMSIPTLICHLGGESERLGFL